MRWVLIAVLILLVSCSGKNSGSLNDKLNYATGKNIGVNKMQIKSTAFDNNQRIPAKYTCQGKDINPNINFFDVPNDTKTLVLIMDDPDAPGGTWDHWVLFNILPGQNIEENSVPSGALQGKNSWGRNDYGGPCPPTGTHRYFFKAYALDTILDIPMGSTKKEVEKAMDGHLLAEAQMVGLYSKS